MTIDLEGMEKRIKITANLSRTIVDALREIAVKRHISLTEALRQSISMEKFWLDASLSGHRVILENTLTGKMREVILNPGLQP